jgi:hypothetical protein
MVMAWFAAAIPYVVAAVSVAGAAYGVIQQQKASKKMEESAGLQRDAAIRQAEELERQSLAEQASAQRAAKYQRRQAEILASRARAVAGASGGGVADPTVQNLIDDIQGEGAYRSSVELYQGEESARQLRRTAENARITGQLQFVDTSSRAQAAQTRSYGSAISGASSMFQRFANGGFSRGGGSDGFDSSSLTYSGNRDVDTNYNYVSGGSY